MPLELKPLQPRLGLRKATEDLYSPENLADQRAREVDAMTQVGRGWEAAGLGSRANATYAQARKAYLAGDLEGGRVLEQQAQDLDQQTAEVAPRVSSLRDINGFGDAMDWAAGAVGNMRTSIAPALGGLAGAAIGTVAAPLTGGVVNPATAGFAGSALAGGQEEYNEAIGSAMRDPTIRATKSMEEIGDTSLGKAAVNSMLEAAVPTIMGGKLLGKGAKSVVGSGTAGAVKHVAKNVGGGAAGEFVTEGAQSLSGQAAQNALFEKPLTDFDYLQALDEAAAGAVGGGGIGVIGGGADVAYNRLGKGVDKVNEVRKDPVGKAVDAIADAGTALGKGRARFEEWMERATSAPTRSRDALIYPERYSMSQDDLKGSATAWAEHVLNNQRDFSERERNDAAEFIKGGNTELYRTKVEIAHRENQIANDDMNIVDEIAERLGKKSKSSEMRASDRMYIESELLKPDFSPQQLETTADIWRKQGVSQKLLKATSEHTDSKQREMAIAMMGWIQNGFSDVDGEMFVPERFTAAYGKNAPKLIRSAAEQALFDGMIDDKTFAKLAEVETMAQMQHAENTAAYDAVVGNMTEAARNAYSPDSIKEFIPEMRRMAQEGTTKAEENFLLRLYGSKEKIAAAMSKFKDKGNESKIVGPMAESAAQRDEDGNVVNDENALVEDDYENDVEIAPGEERTTYEGLGDDHVPYNTLYDDKKKELATRLSTLANEPKKFSRAIGAWTALKEQFGHNPTLLREKEDQALSKSLSKGVLPKMNDDRRTSLLKAYDKNFKVIKVTESLSDTLPDTVTPQQIESFREKSHNAQIKGEWVTGGGNTPENGRLYLERKETINKETGEATGKNEAFLTSAARLIRHVWDSEGKQGEGRTNASAGKGALGEYQAFLRGLSALIQSDGSFTGRVGVIGPDGKMKLVGEKGALPGTLRLMNGTVAAAKRQQKQETLSGDAMGAPLSDKDISAEAGDEITSYTDRNIVPSESTSSEARADTLLAEGSTGEIYRDEKTGIQTGLGLDAEAFAVGGHGKTTGTTPVASRKKGDVVEGLTDADRAENERRKAAKKEPIYPKDKGASTGLTTSDKAAEPLSAPLATRPTPDRLKGELPFDHGLQKRLATERTDLGARKMSDAESNLLKAAWNALGRRSRGGLLSSAFGQIGHIFTLAKGNAGGKYLGWMGEQAGGVIGIAASSFKEQSPLFTDIPAQIRYLLAHEAAHALDHTGNNDAVYSTHSTFKIERVGDKWVAHGAVAKEMFEASKDDSHPLYALVTKTPFNGKITDAAIAQKEMFAQAVAMFYTRNTTLKKALPETYKHVEALNDRTILQTTADGRGRDAGNNGQADSAEHETARSDKSQRNQLPTSPAARTEGRGTDGAERSGVSGRYSGERTGGGFAFRGQRERTGPPKALSEEEKTKNSEFEKRLEWVTTQLGKGLEGFKETMSKLSSSQLGVVRDIMDGAGGSNKSIDFDRSDKEAVAFFAEARQIVEDLYYGNSPKFVNPYAGAIIDGDGGGVAGALVNKQSAINADIQGRQAKQEDVDAAVKHLTDTLGDSVKVDFKKYFGDNSSGRWTERRKRNLIELALNGDVLGTAYHESMHEFFNQLGRHGAENVQALMKRVATNKIILRQLHKLLKDHEKAIAQLNDPEEALAYMYQFWQAGLLKIGPETQTFFDKVAHFLRTVFKRVQPEIKDMQQAELLLRAFSGGAIKESATKAAAIEAMRKDIEAHDRAIEALGKGTNAMIDAFGKLTFSAEAMMERTGNKHMVEIMRMANQKAGESMRDKQAYFDAVHAAKGRWMNKLQNMLTGHDQDVLNIARESLNTGKPTYHPEAKALAANVRKYLDEMFDYVTERGVMRWDSEAVNKKWGTKGDWVPVQKRKDYFMQVWSTETLLKNKDEFIKLMLEHHVAELNHIAKEANSEVDAVFSGKGWKLGQSAKAAVDAAHADTGKAVVGRKDVQAVTAEHIAEAIYARVINANGHIDLAESTSNLGMSPAASAVNRRELDWLKKDAFDKFMEQDLVKILTTYTQSMVKRAEYTHSFGAGGEKVTDLADRAVLHELGGDTLITKAEKRLPLMVQAWKKAKAKAIAAGDQFVAPFPTLRHAGYQIHELSSQTASDDLRAAVKKLEPGFKAVMAIEGTLGNDISPSLRAVNSTLITYQNLRLMVPGLFSQYNDVMGVVVKGGTLGDAWDAFVRSMREIRLSWKGEKSTDKQAQRAEMWGTVEATAALDALGQTFGSMYLTGGAKRMNDALFKWNGMEAFNRAVRITATSVAERVITNYRTNGYDANNKAEVAMFERLFGKNLDPKAIQLGADGGLDTTNPANQAAVMRWVSDAIMLPNASHRPTWASDPHFAPFWQFKQFAYTMHRVMLKNVLEQAKLGNYRPGMVLLVGYAPVMIAADAVKELLIPGDEPPWMKMGLGSMIEHGVDRAGVFGIPQMFGEAVVRDYGIGLLGPSVGQISGMISDPLARSALGSLPAGSLLRRAATE